MPGQVYQVKGTNLLVGVQEPGIPLSIPGGQSGIPNWGGSLQFQSLPAVPTSLAWANSNSGKLVTVQAQGSNDAWRVITEPVSYQLATDQGTVQVNGTLIVGTDLGNISATVGRLVGAELIVGLIILVILAMAVVAVVRANLRPLVDIEETAGEIADGHLNRRVPERDPRTEIGSLGRSLNIMLSQIETAFHAREESEAAAHQSEERMRRFIADAGHELRTPLTAIRGFAEYYRQRGGLVPHWDRRAAGRPGRRPGIVHLRGAAPREPAGEDGLTPDDLDRLMQRVEKEAARMGLLVEDLLLLARLDQQRPLARQPVDLLSLAGDAVHDARLLAPARTVDLSVQPGAAFLVIGDEPRLRQVIGNLMSNALTHTPDGTPIEVSIGSGTLDPRLPGLLPGRDARRDRPRARHDDGTGPARVRALLPDGPGQDARHRRQRARPGHRERARHRARRRRLGADRSRPGARRSGSPCRSPPRRAAARPRTTTPTWTKPARPARRARHAEGAAARWPRTS